MQSELWLNQVNRDDHKHTVWDFVHYFAQGSPFPWRLVFGSRLNIFTPPRKKTARVPLLHHPCPPSSEIGLVGWEGYQK